MNKPNVAPFELGGWPLDLVSQKQMRQLRKIADENGWPLAEVIEDAVRLFAEKHNATRDAKEKIIKFPRRLNRRPPLPVALAMFQ